MNFMNDFQHLKVKLEDVKAATNNFGRDKSIGGGGFGQVYKGELSSSEGRIEVAFKRLDRKYGQGDTEFWKEIMMLSKYRHENLVSLMHFCNEGAERVLVYEYASRGSLDRYLSDPSLTWIQRLRICIGAARGLNYLHDPMGMQQRVIHRDIKSSNILLDDKWIAKVSDFGLSKIGPANQLNTFLVSNAVGTPGYCDPLYMEMGFLSKESDIYSFGVVLFEVMCGRLCYEYRNGELSSILVPIWKKCYEDKRLDEIISPDLKMQMDGDSLNTYSEIAYRCLMKAHIDRPTMAEILIELNIALEQQELLEDTEKRINFDEIIKIADLVVPKLSYRSPKELLWLLSKGILVDDGTTWLTLNKKGEICEMISATKCMFKEAPNDFPCVREDRSRFQNAIPYVNNTNFEVEVSTNFLSPDVTYAISLVYKYQNNMQGLFVPFNYKLDNETRYWTSCVAHLREDNWMVTELYQFTSYQKKHDFRIQICNKSNRHGGQNLLLEGIEFQPLEYDKDEKLEDVNMVDMQLIAYSDTDWEQKLPSDYPEIIKLSKDSVHWTNKKELYCLFHSGFLINNGEQWFSIAKNGMKCYMLPATTILQEERSILRSLSGRKKWISKPLQESRFQMAAEFHNTITFSILYVINPRLLSPGVTYACYLVYKLPENHSMSNTLIYLEPKYIYTHYRPIYLLTPPHTPIIRSQESQKSNSSSGTRKIKGHPKLRKDGWMEMKVWEFPLDPMMPSFSNCLRFTSCDEWKFNGLLVQGVEFRPVKVYSFDMM